MIDPLLWYCVHWSCLKLSFLQPQILYLRYEMVTSVLCKFLWPRAFFWATTQQFWIVGGTGHSTYWPWFTLQRPSKLLCSSPLQGSKADADLCDMMDTLDNAQLNLTSLEKNMSSISAGCIEMNQQFTSGPIWAFLPGSVESMIPSGVCSNHSWKGEKGLLTEIHNPLG